MSRLEWTLGIILVVLLAAVIVLSALFWFRPGTPEPVAVNTAATAVAARAQIPAPTSVYEGRTAKVAFATAQKAAEAWQADARLAGAAATWPQGTDRRTLLTGETTWNFTYYSPAKGVNAVIAVTEDEAALVSEAAAPGSIIPDVTAWELDSKDVLTQFLDQGGTEFLQSEAITTLTMILANDQENGRLQWLVLLFAPANGRTFTMKIDATSGEIIQNTGT